MDDLEIRYCMNDIKEYIKRVKKEIYSGEAEIILEEIEKIIKSYEE